ncbi:hypothetical protein [Burkholderia territorii]|uniref:hypothetical protein n=1 Tax=Burkholderia territorii TaxID=1503055 RepID=UPI0012D8C3F0|nr:hypothetical protein [Burkholderia territorii]
MVWVMGGWLPGPVHAPADDRSSFVTNLGATTGLAAMRRVTNARLHPKVDFMDCVAGYCAVTVVLGTGQPATLYVVKLNEQRRFVGVSAIRMYGQRLRIARFVGGPPLRLYVLSSNARGKGPYQLFDVEERDSGQAVASCILSRHCVINQVGNQSALDQAIRLARRQSSQPV